MTNKEAATIVERIRYYMEGGECWTDAEFIAMDMAIESLNRQDIPDINVSDMIYRQAAIDALMDEFKRIPTMAIRAKHVIGRMPSAQPEKTQLSEEDTTSDCISRHAAIDAMENTDWYHINKDGQLTHGANSSEDEPLYKAEDVYKVLNDMPSVPPNLQPTCNNLATDAISRQAAIGILYNFAGCIVDTPSGDYRRAYEASRHELETLPPAHPEPHYDEWCDDCKEYDKERHCCPRWNKVIRETLKDARPDQKWIPCSERLPKEEERRYWVCTDTGYQCQCRWTNDVYGFGASDRWEWKIFDIPQYQKVVAWMPLPEPYSERRTDD